MSKNNFQSFRAWSRIHGQPLSESQREMSKEMHDEWEDFYDEGVTVIYPGSFKPMTGGHLSLIETYLSHPFVNKVIVYVGTGVRNGIDQDMAFSIAQDLTSHLSNVEVEKSPYPSPILTAYKAMESAEPGNYALAASKKGDDYKRVESFTQQHEPGGKYHDKLPEGVSVYTLPVDAKPLVFKGRDDDQDRQPISASTIRRDVMEQDYDNFAAGYPQVSDGQIRKVWNTLQGVVTEAFVGTIPGGADGYEDVDPEDRYKYRVQTLEEGGGAGHMKNVWEANDLSFADLRTLIQQALSGSLENVTEKLDGQNIMLSWKDDELRAARNKGHLKNFGETSLNIEGMKEFFGGRGAIEVAFVEAMRDMQSTINKSNIDPDEIFENGKHWLNIEVLYPDTENIIPYGESQLRIHHIREIDENGDLVRVHDDQLDKLTGAIAEVQNMEEETFFIQRTNPVTIQQIENLDNISDKLISQLQWIQDKYDIDDNETIQDYIDESIKNFIAEEWDKHNFEVDVELIESLVRRWGYADKSTPINKLLKGKDPEIVKWVRETDKKIGKIIKKIISPVEKIFLQLGATVLNNLKGLAASNPSQTADKIKQKVDQAIKELNAEVNKLDDGDPERIEKISEFLGTQLERLEQAGGFDAIAPTEGIVFEFKGNLLKLTGNYGPVNQLIGYLKFGR